MGRLPGGKVRAVAAALGLLAAVVSFSCAAPPVHYFASPPGGYREIGVVRDTVRLRRIDGRDSVVVEGVRLADRVRRSARAADAVEAADVLDRVLAAIPLPDSIDVAGDDRATDRDLVLRLSAGSPAQRMDLARADAVVVTGVRVDSLDLPEVVPDSVAADTPTVGRWLVMVLTATTYLDPTLGTRPNVR